MGLIDYLIIVAICLILAAGVGFIISLFTQPEDKP